MKAATESCGPGSLYYSLHEDAAVWDKGSLLVFTVHLTSFLFAAIPRSASNPKAP